MSSQSKCQMCVFVEVEQTSLDVVILLSSGQSELMSELLALNLLIPPLTCCVQVTPADAQSSF